MTYPSSNDPAFLVTVRQWIETNGEVFALIRFHASAGAKSFEFYHSVDAFQGRLQELPPRTCITIFGSRQLPLRGKVDEEFIRQALALVPEGSEFLLVALKRTTVGDGSWFHNAAGESHAELLEALRDDNCNGKEIAVGTYPLWLEDNEAVISAVVPAKDGSVTTGAY